MLGAGNTAVNKWSVCLALISSGVFGEIVGKPMGTDIPPYHVARCAMKLWAPVPLSWEGKV